MPARTLQLRNFTSILEDIQIRFQAIAEKAISGMTMPTTESEQLLKDIQTTQQTILQRCQKRGCQPADLSDAGYRGFLWLVFLSDPDHFKQHLQFLSRFLQKWKAKTHRVVSVRMYNSPFVFQCKPGRDGYTVTIGEGFVSADPQTVQILVDCSVRSNRRNLTQLRALSRSAAYKRIMELIWQHSAQSSRSTHGNYYDLQQLFHKINAEYFQNRLEQPRLCWSSRRATRRLGYYHPDTDTITLSCYLDQQSIPPYVVEYVLYHEMLHKRVGLKEVNTYRLAHTAQFKQQERKFQYYEEAEKFLKRFTRT